MGTKKKREKKMFLQLGWYYLPLGPVKPPKSLVGLKKLKAKASGPVLPSRRTGTTAQLPTHFRKYAKCYQNVPGGQNAVSGT
jgi:hypothetical protein